MQPETPMPVIPPERGDDLHEMESADAADLVVFMAGNQFMVMADLASAFMERYPRVRRMSWETLPPGMMLRQILANGAQFGESLLTGRPDVYTSVSGAAMRSLSEAGLTTDEDVRLYLHNKLALMVPAGNPAGIESVADLARDHVRVSQPDPANEDIGRHIEAMYRAAGGEELARRIMVEKREQGTTLFTTVHHRETPDRLEQGLADVGPVWATEVANALKRGAALEGVAVPAQFDRREHIRYYACVLKDAPNPENARRFADFLFSDEARRIYESAGFIPHVLEGER